MAIQARCHRPWCWNLQGRTLSVMWCTVNTCGLLDPCQDLQGPSHSLDMCSGCRNGVKTDGAWRIIKEDLGTGSLQQQAASASSLCSAWKACLGTEEAAAPVQWHTALAAFCYKQYAVPQRQSRRLYWGQVALQKQLSDVTGKGQPCHNDRLHSCLKQGAYLESWHNTLSHPVCPGLQGQPLKGITCRCALCLHLGWHRVIRVCVQPVGGRQPQLSANV